MQLHNHNSYQLALEDTDFVLEPAPIKKGGHLKSLFWGLISGYVLSFISAFAVMAFRFNAATTQIATSILATLALPIMLGLLPFIAGAYLFRHSNLAKIIFVCWIFDRFQHRNCCQAQKPAIQPDKVRAPFRGRAFLVGALILPVVLSLSSSAFYEPKDVESDTIQNTPTHQSADSGRAGSANHFVAPEKPWIGPDTPIEEPATTTPTPALAPMPTPATVTPGSQASPEQASETPPPAPQVRRATPVATQTPDGSMDRPFVIKTEPDHDQIPIGSFFRDLRPFGHDTLKQKVWPRSSATDVGTQVRRATPPEVRRATPVQVRRSRAGA